MPKITVIICTFNRGDILKNAVASLSKQTASKKTFEVIIVDNGSSDKTKRVVVDMKREYPNLNIRYIHESHEGLSNARNVGVAHAKGYYVAFLDDDAQAHNEWISKILGYIDQATFPSIALGGVIRPMYDGKKPEWFRDSYESDIKGDTNRYLKSGETFSGSNMILRKEYIPKFGGFNIDIGMKGKYMSVGEETSLFELMWDTYKKEKKLFFYSPYLIVYHRVAPHRLRVSYRLKRNLIAGQALFIRSSKKSMYKKITLAGKMFLRTVVAVILIPVPVWPFYPQRWIVDRLGPVLFGGGFFLSLLNISFAISRD